MPLRALSGCGSRAWPWALIFYVACGGSSFESAPDGSGGVGVAGNAGDTAIAGDNAGGDGEPGNAGSGATSAGTTAAGATATGGAASGGAGSGGVNGGQNPGGSTSTGGTTGGGGATGGGGSGGTSGSGGTTLGGSSGGGGTDCAALENTYLSDLAKARICDANAMKIQCSIDSTLPSACNCPVFVAAGTEATQKARSELKTFTDAGCSFPACGIACIAYSGAACQMNAGSTGYTCTGTLAAP